MPEQKTQWKHVTFKVIDDKPLDWMRLVIAWLQIWSNWKYWEKVREDTDNIFDRESGVGWKKNNNPGLGGDVKSKWSRWQLEWEKTKRGAEKDCVDTDMEERCVQLISRIPRWTFLRGGWEPCCENEAWVPDEARDSSAERWPLQPCQEAELGKKTAQVRQGQGPGPGQLRALLWLVEELLEGQLPPSLQVGWSWFRVLNRARRKKNRGTI